MEDRELTSGLQDFFNENESDAGKSGKTVGGIGVWILHLVMFAFVIYSAYHGINATAAYRAAQGLGSAAGIVGIIIIELVMIGIYLAYFNRRIVGGSQKIAAGVTFGLGFVLACLGIIGDSQTQADMTVSSWLVAYLTWLLPVAPALMALGAAVTAALDPGLLRKMTQAAKHEEFEEKKHGKRMAAKAAELRVAEGLANMQLNAKMDAARYVLAAYRAPEVQDYIRRSALANMPDLMRSIGVDLPYGTVIEGQAIEAPIQPPPISADETPVAAEPERKPGLFDRAKAKLGIGEDMSNYTQEQPEETQPAQPAPGQGGNGPAGHRVDRPNE